MRLNVPGFRQRLLCWAAALFDRLRCWGRSVRETMSNISLNPRDWFKAPETSALGSANWFAGLLLTTLLASPKLDVPYWVMGGILLILAVHSTNYWFLYWHFAQHSKAQLLPANQAVEMYRIDREVTNRGQRRSRSKAAETFVSDAENTRA